MSKGKSTTTTTTDPKQMEIYQDLYNKAQGIASQPFVPYTGSRVAGFNPDQLMGFGATRNMFNQSMGFDPRSQLNNLANMSAPSVNLPFGYNQPQQPSPIFQPMPITGGGRPTPPPSIGGPGGGGPVFPSPGRSVTTDSEYGPITDTLLGFGDRALRPRGPIVGGMVPEGGGLFSGGPVMLPPDQLPQAEKDFQNLNIENRLKIAKDRGIEIDLPIMDNRLPRPRVNPGLANPRPGVTVPRPDPIRNPIRPGLLNPPQSQTNPFSPTQLGPAAMQEASKIAPVDLYSGASVNRGDIRDVTPRSLLDTDLGAYQNPFQSQVIDNTLDDLNRARQLQIQSDQDAAIGRGAFGGSRSALLESETNRNFAEQAGKLASNLRSQGFDRATGLAGQDIDRQFGADKFMSDADRAIAMQNATFGQQAGLARQGLLGDVAQNQARLDASRFAANQDALNRFGLQQGQFNNQMNMGMFDAANRAAFMQPELEMRNRQFQAGLLGDQLSDQYRSLGLLSGIGSQQQGLQQRGMDAAYNEFLRALGYGPQQLGLLAQGVSALPGDQASTNQYKPGTMEQIGNAAGTIGAVMGLFSDERLKDNITLVGKSKGHNVYTWTWNDVAKKLGINTPEIGVIAQEVAHIPNAVFKHESGFLTVNYGAL